jgi:aminopeptidase N
VVPTFRSRRLRLWAVALTAGALVFAAPASAADVGAGPLTSGDSLFPHQGNGGYNAQSYHLDLTYVRHGHALKGLTTMTARARQDLTSFGLDLEGLHVSRVWVNGARASFHRGSDKLVVTPVRELRIGSIFTTRIQYAGVPRTHVDPDGSSEGWIPTADGVVALNEPVGAMTWFPNNNTPRDKARYRFTIHAPKGLEVASNGRLVRRTTKHGIGTWHYVMAKPMASYLAFLAIGQFKIHHSKTSDGIRLLSFTDPKVPTPTAALKKLPGILHWLQTQFGPYPFADAGFVDDKIGVDYALETQTRPTFDGTVPITDLVHELAHQWFGDAVTPADWGDIWLNEGFATYTEWLWAARTGESTADQFTQLLAAHPADDSFWQTPPQDLGDPANLFGNAVYERGAMTLEALRETIGDVAFDTTMRQWYAGRRGQSASTAEFIDLAEQTSGQDLTSFFHNWLDQPARPTGW